MPVGLLLAILIYSIACSIYEYFFSSEQSNTSDYDECDKINRRTSIPQNRKSIVSAMDGCEILDLLEDYGYDEYERKSLKRDSIAKLSESRLKDFGRNGRYDEEL